MRVTLIPRFCELCYDLFCFLGRIRRPRVLCLACFWSAKLGSCWLPCSCLQLHRVSWSFLLWCDKFSCTLSLTLCVILSQPHPPTHAHAHTTCTDYTHAPTLFSLLCLSPSLSCRSPSLAHVFFVYVHAYVDVRVRESKCVVLTPF